MARNWNGNRKGIGNGAETGAGALLESENGSESAGLDLVGLGALGDGAAGKARQGIGTAACSVTGRVGLEGVR